MTTSVADRPAPLQDFNFGLLDSPEFKEDSVREEVILPLLKAIGYAASGPNKIVRSKGLEHPFLTVGSKKKPITLIPDYLLTVDGNFTVVLDAKAPREEIKTGDNVEQVYSYAIHPEIRVELFGLCNGREFILFDVHQKEPILYFHLSELRHYWDDVLKYLAPVKAATQLPNRLRSVAAPFRKVRNPKTIGKIALGAPVMDVVMETIESVIAMHHGATLEQINDELVIRGLELGFLDILAKEYADLTPLLMESFEFDDKTKVYNLRKNRKFKTHIPLELRVRYFVVSYLKRLEHRHEHPTFDEIVLNIMPLLKNGATPEDQTILKVLETVAERVGTDRWRLIQGDQQLLF